MPEEPGPFDGLLLSPVQRGDRLCCYHRVVFSFMVVITEKQHYLVALSWLPY